MARTGLTQTRAEALQVVPAPLVGDRAPQPCAHPRRYRSARPALALGRGAAERLAQLFQLRAREQLGCPPRPGVLPIDYARRSLGVIAFGDLADPVP